jgi:class IV lanthipeptide synthase
VPAGSHPVAVPLDLAPERDPIRHLLESRVPWATHGDVFSTQHFGAGPWPEQGWKLHVAATPLSAAAVFERSLPVLLDEGVRFKVVGTRLALVRLNSGLFGAPQVGKFLTVYPSDDAQAVRLAVALDEATRGLPGPRVPTDRPLRSGSLVHYRYGSLQRRVPPVGEDEPEPLPYDLLDPAGRLTYDPRPPYYLAPPPEVEDPFEAAGVYVPAPARSGAFAGRYLIFDLLWRSWRGGVFRAIDLKAEPARVCLLKEVWHDVGTDRYGRDAGDWADNEARLLARHDGDVQLPSCYDRFELDGNTYLSLEYVEGTPVDGELGQNPAVLTGIAVADLIEIGRGTAAALAHLHELGIVFRDFNPANAIRTPDGGFRLVDFGLAYDLGADRAEPPLGLGTRPFYPPEQYAGQTPALADDVYAWGVLMHQLACGWSASEQPGSDRVPMEPVPRQAVRDIRPLLPAELAAVIDRAVAWDRADRYPTMREALEAFTAAAAKADEPDAPRTSAFQQSRRESAAAAATHEEPIAVARAVADALCASAIERDGGLCWSARDPVDGREYLTPDLYSGAAGIALFLAELARATGEQRYADAARGAASWLAGPIWGHGRALPGLHIGESGVGYFFLRLAKLLEEPGYVYAAELRARRMADLPFKTVDLLSGAAGAALFLVRLAAASADDAYLRQASVAGSLLVQAARPGPGGAGCFWEVGTLDPSESARPYLGMAHGAAGIALALDELGRATEDDSYLDCAQRAAALLLLQAKPHGTGRVWPCLLGDPEPGVQAWCHGAGGIGRFFLNRISHDPDPSYEEAGRQAAQTIAEQIEAREHSGLCHGLAGDGSFFLECERVLGDLQYLELARRCFRRLDEFRTADRGVYRVGQADTVSPDLWLGYAGVGAFCLRLAEREAAHVVASTQATARQASKRVVS